MIADEPQSLHPVPSRAGPHTLDSGVLSFNLMKYTEKNFLILGPIDFSLCSPLVNNVLPELK